MIECKAGFSRVVITPPLGVGLAGYFNERPANGVLDELEANCIAVYDGTNTAIIMSCDLIYGDQNQMDINRKRISEETGVPYEAIFIACTHTHTGPYVRQTAPLADLPYLDMLSRKLAAAAALAIADLAPVTAEAGSTIVKDISFVRRFMMKDGTIRTNPGIGNPEIAHPIGEPDETVQALRLKRCGKPEILVVNFQVHPDTVGGCKFSADYPRFVRETVEAALPNVKCVYFNGAQGDTNHINVKLEPDHYKKCNAVEPRTHAMHMGRAIAGGVLQIYGKLSPIELGEIKFRQINTEVPTNRGTEADMPEAERIYALHAAGKDNEIPGEGMAKTTIIARASRILALRNGPDSLTLYVSGIRFGNVSFVGFPGEPFTDMGRNAKARSPFALTIPCCLTNGGQGYYPVKAAYDEGGYEAMNSRFKAGVAEILTDVAVELLESLEN